ncbi:MAG: PAS domain S-box protein [Candidatus Zixiibacteriota bacterium]
MKQNEPRSKRLVALRKKAEEKLRGKSRRVPELSAEQTRQLMQELQVHQIELEMQNEDLRKTQQEMAESQARYSDLYDFAPVGYFSFDKDGLIVEVNLTGAGLLGVDRKALIRKPFHLYVAPDDRDIFYLHLRRALQAGTRQTCEIRLVKNKRSASQFFARLESLPVRDGQGKLHLCRTAIADITDQKRMTEELEKEKDRAQRYLDIAGVALVAIDTEHRVILINKKGCEILCYREDEIRGKNWFDHFIPEKERNRVKSSFGKFMAGEIEPVASFESLVLTRDGEERVVAWHNTVLRDETGNVVGTLSSGQDVTERRRAEEALRQSEKKYRDLVENINDVIYATNEKGVITYISPRIESLIGYSTSEIIGRNFLDFVPPEDKPGMLRGFSGVAPGKVQPGEFRLLSKSRGILWFRTHNRPVYNRQKLMGFRGVLTDISESKRLWHQLVQSEKLAAVGTLAYGIAHEFNNILAGMTINAELGLNLSTSQPLRECFEAILENSQRGSSITHSLLAVAGEKRGKKELVDLTQCLENVLSFSRRELEKANVKTIQGFKPISKIFCDPGEWTEVFLNVINNSRDAMYPEGGTLTISVEPYKDDIRVVFKDTGSGIPDELKGRIFDAFVTSKGALGKSDVPGTGLGLFVTYGIVESYNGKIEVKSQVGKGTTFTILIPVSKNQPPESFGKGQTKSAEDTRKRLNILLIDDERTICSVLKKLLESKGHTVTASLEAAEGLELFTKNKFDVVLSDLTMPGMDGIELIRRMKEWNQETKIIVLTGHIQSAKEREAKHAGADEVLLKPFRNDLLYQTIARLSQKNQSGEEASEPI